MPRPDYSTCILPYLYAVGGSDRAFGGSDRAFVDSCAANSVGRVKQMLADGVNVNVRDSHGVCGLYRAVVAGSMETVSVLLACKDVVLCQEGDTRTSKTVLHIACVHNQLQVVKMILAHPACTRQAVTATDHAGKTAEMVAVEFGNLACADLIRDFLSKPIAFPGPLSCPPTPSSLLVPECPVCMEKMKPPLRIFNCDNGHLICSTCRPRISEAKCHCRALYRGRATAMEQIIRQLIGGSKYVFD